MRRYLFSSGIIGVVTSGITLLRAIREREPFTWRSALAWAMWAITLALAVGAMVDTHRARLGEPVPADSPVAEDAEKLARRHARH